MEDRSVQRGVAIDILGLVRAHGRRVLLGSAAVAGVVAVAGAVYLYWGQPVRRASVLEFRPTFSGAAQGQYPNGLPFAPADVAAGPIVDLVYDANAISQYCPREVYRGGFFVDRRSVQSTILDADFRGRLTDIRLTNVERQQVLAEYEAKRAALPLNFALVFVKPPSCAAIPQVVVEKALVDVLTTWASESETKRGVLNHHVEVLTPAMLDVGVGIEGVRLLRADLLRTGLWRIVSNIELVEAIPGAGLVRAGAERLTFLEVRNKLIDLARSRLEPLVVTAGQSLVRESLTWVNETVASAEREQVAAEGKARAYLVALREYSGQPMPTATPGSSPASQAGSSDVQTLSPNIDQTFIDRIVAMSDRNSVYRQELTGQMVTATIEAVSAKDRVAYYVSLLRSLREPGRPQLASEEIDKRLEEIVAQGKGLTKQFNDLYSEFSRVSLRAASAMYQADRPVATQVSREFTARSLMMLVAGAFFVTLVLALGYVVIRDRLTTEAA